MAGAEAAVLRLSLAIGVMLGLLILLKAIWRCVVAAGRWSAVRPSFGELMMFVYFGYMLPLSTRITRGLYADGIWTDTGFMPYAQIGGHHAGRKGEPPRRWW